LDEVVQPATESYVSFFEETDQRAGTNWQTIFTELV